MNITLICVGRIKEDHFRDACSEYEKRLGAFCRFNTEIIEPERLSDNPSQAEIHNALNREGEKILKKIPSGAYVCAMCVEGKEMTSAQLADITKTLPLKGVSSVVFIIGSSFGLGEEVKAAADLKLSMSKMTFPHQLARVMLSEQIYRAYTIIYNKRYHK